jgi:hypothetical protein
MKKITIIALILTIISFSSCKKKTTEPAPAPSSTEVVIPDEAIDVQYRVTSASGNFKVEYTALENDIITVFNKDVSKANFTYSFNWVEGKTLSIKASNTTPSTKKLIVEIYVNGALFKSGQTTTMDVAAFAEGVYKK